MNDEQLIWEKYINEDYNRNCTISIDIQPEYQNYCNKITFSEIDKKILMDLNNITACTSDCNESGKSYCLVSENNECQFIIPKNNLVSGAENMKLYFGRISDELLRYKRVQLFMLNPKSYLNKYYFRVIK
jgi:hypothetical protein